MTQPCFDDLCPVPVRHVVTVPNAHPRDRYPLRRVTHYELEYIREGGGAIEVDGESLPAQSCTLMLRRPGQLVQGRGVYHSRFFAFDCTPGGGRHAGLDALPGVCRPDQPWAAEELFAGVFAAFESDAPAGRLHFMAGTLRLVACYAESTRPEAAGAAAAGADALAVIRASEAYIRRSYAQPLQVGQLAQQAGYSLYHYAHLFRQVTGLPPLKYLHKVRIAHARARLLETNLPTESIMRECGFQNYPNFLRIFKSLNGTTPGQYRLEHRLEPAGPPMEAPDEIHA